MSKRTKKDSGTSSFQGWPSDAENRRRRSSGRPKSANFQHPSSIIGSFASAIIVVGPLGLFSVNESIGDQSNLKPFQLGQLAHFCVALGKVVFLKNAEFRPISTRSIAV